MQDSHIEDFNNKDINIVDEIADIESEEWKKNYSSYGKLKTCLIVNSFRIDDMGSDANSIASALAKICYLEFKEVAIDQIHKEHNYRFNSSFKSSCENLYADYENHPRNYNHIALAAVLEVRPFKERFDELLRRNNFDYIIASKEFLRKYDHYYLNKYLKEVVGGKRRSSPFDKLIKSDKFILNYRTAFE